MLSFRASLVDICIIHPKTSSRSTKKRRLSTRKGSHRCIIIMLSVNFLSAQVTALKCHCSVFIRFSEQKECTHAHKISSVSSAPMLSRSWISLILGCTNHRAPIICEFGGIFFINFTFTDAQTIIQTIWKHRQVVNDFRIRLPGSKQ